MSDQGIRSLNEWTKKEFEALPSRGWNEDIGEFNSLVILPVNHEHDSGFLCMDFVAVRGDTPICRLSGCSDVLHIDGIGGYGIGYGIFGNKLPQHIEPKGWSIDCLKKSKLLRLFAPRMNLKAGVAISSFEIYAVRGITNQQHESNKPT